MSETYTYTARSARNPSQAATFTLYDEQLVINDITDPSDWVVENLTQSFFLEDVEGTYDHDNLALRIWTRTGGLRLVPVDLEYRPVDDPQGAREFIQELNTRRGGVTVGSTLPGAFDYWATWVGIAALLVILGVLLNQQNKSRA